MTHSHSKIIYSKTSNDNLVTIESFTPRSEGTLNRAISENPGKKIYYLQRPDEKLHTGRLYSHIFYSPNIEFFERPFELDSSYEIKQGSSPIEQEAVKDLAISQNENEIIFPNTMLESFKKNSKLLDESALSVQVYENNLLIGHISAIKLTDDIFTGPNHYCLLRFIVKKEYRRGDLKEFLINQLSIYLPSNSSLTFQIFPQNIKAKIFFSRRMNVVPYYERWVID